MQEFWTFFTVLILSDNIKKLFSFDIYKTVMRMESRVIKGINAEDAKRKVSESYRNVLKPYVYNLGI